MKTIKELEEQELGPFTLEEAKKEIFRLEDVATLARDTASASNIILANLMFELHSKNVIDVEALLKGLHDDCHKIEQNDVSLSVKALTTSILLEFAKRTAYKHN